ncbi:MAG: hypothetical protein ABEJ91_04280 [Candidatus Nanohaloarchaea archaeon]
MPETEVEVVQYPAGRLRSFFSPEKYDWSSTELYMVLDRLGRNLSEVEEDATIEPEFSYPNGDTAESFEELLEAGEHSPLEGGARVEAGPVEGHIEYIPAVGHETSALTAEFEVPEVYEQQLRDILGEAGFKDPVVPRISHRAIQG